MLFKLELIEMLIVERAECRSCAAESPDQSELGSDIVDDQTEAQLPCKLETLLGVRLCLQEVISRREKIRDQVVAAICRKGKVTDFVCGIECAIHQITTGPDMSRPRHDHISEAHISPSLKALQSMFFDQVIAESAETEGI